MNRRDAVLAVAALAAVPAAAAAPKYPFELYIRPIDNGYLMKVYVRGEGIVSPIGEPELMAPDSATAAVVLKVWLDALK